MRLAALGVIAATALTAGCVGDGGSRYGVDPRYRTYDYNRPDPAYNGYDAGRYYREDARYRERRLAATSGSIAAKTGVIIAGVRTARPGLIVGGVAGGVLGNIIAPGGSETLGTLLGAAGGALAGRAIDRDQARCK